MKNHSIKRVERDVCGEQLTVFRDRITKLQQSASQTPLEVLNVALDELRNAAEELSAMHEDILEQKEAILAAQHAVEAEQARYRDLFDFAPLPYITTDIWGKIQESNIAASKLLNVPQKFLLDKALIFFIDENAHSTFSSHLVAAQEKAIVEWEVSIRPRNRQPRRTSITIAPVSAPGAKINSLRWVMRDITEQKRLEKQLRQNAVLTALGTGVAKIAHGIANPLSGMFLSVQMLLERLSQQQEKPEGGTLRIAMELKEEMKRLHALLQELREFSRPWQADPKPVRLSQMIAETISAVHLESYPGPIRIEQQVSSNLPPLMADEDKLKEALLNLITNAVEAMPDGGRITVRCYQEAQQVCLEIEDSGVGIPPGMRIFEPFVTSKGDGWGLGLAIVHGAIAAHDGTIGYTSEPGQGTRFRLACQ